MYRWYAINTYSGHEHKVREDLHRRAESFNARADLREVIIPTEKVYEGSGDERKQVEKRTMPGYVLVHMDLNETSWSVVRYTPGVTGFVGPGGDPEPLSKLEVDRVLGRSRQTKVALTEPTFSVGDRVRIMGGPLTDFQGLISEISPETSRVKVLVSIFGRETPTDVGFEQLEKA